MLFADADVFWKPPNVYDAIGVAGFVVGVGSVWLTWWLAKRDIDERLKAAVAEASEAARDEIRRLAAMILRTGVGDTIRWLDLAREACRGKQWQRAAQLCELAREQLTRTGAQSPTVVSELETLATELVDCLVYLRAQSRAGTGALPAAVSRSLDQAILMLHRLEGTITRIRVEGEDG